MLNLWIGAAMLIGLNLGGSEEIKPYSFEVNPYMENEEMVIEVRLENTGEETLNFEFSTSQKYEIEISDEDGKVLYTYSKGKSFLQVLQNLALKPGESQVWTEKLNAGKDEVELKPGSYKITSTITGRLLNDGAGPIRANAQFSIPDESVLNIQTEGSRGTYNVVGEVSNGVSDLYYTVEDGHHVYVNEQKVKVEDNKFEIEIMIDESKLPSNATLLLNLYEKGGDSEGKSLQVIVLERFS